MELFIRPTWADRFPELIIGQSTRLGGQSAVPYTSLNLGWYTEDEKANVQENRRRFAEALETRASFFSGGHQVHGHQVKTIEVVEECEGFDAFVTDRTQIILTVTVADCVPVLIYDPVRAVCGAAHAGWRGTRASIAEQCLSQMSTNYGTVPGACWAYVGACISRPNFEVSRDVAEQFADHLVDGGFPNDKFRVDLKQANVDQLTKMGVPHSQIEVSPYCTVEHNDLFFSYRKEGGKTGRMLGIIGLR